MKYDLQPILRVIVSLIGFYLIFTAIIFSGFSILMIPIAGLTYGGRELEGAAINVLIVAMNLFAPLVIGIFFLLKNGAISRWILRRSGCEFAISIPTSCSLRFSDVAFSLLGLFMLSITIPDFCEYIARTFQRKLVDPGLIPYSNRPFLRDHFGPTTYHVVAVGFSLFVFLKGKSISRFVFAIRKAGQGNPHGNNPESNKPGLESPD